MNNAVARGYSEPTMRSDAENRIMQIGALIAILMSIVVNLSNSLFWQIVGTVVGVAGLGIALIQAFRAWGNSKRDRSEVARRNDVAARLSDYVKRGQVLQAAAPMIPATEDSGGLRAQAAASTERVANVTAWRKAVEIWCGDTEAYLRICLPHAEPIFQTRGGTVDMETEYPQVVWSARESYALLCCRLSNLRSVIENLSTYL